MWPNWQFPAYWVRFTEEILNGKIHFRAVQLIQRNTGGTDRINCPINQEEFPSTKIF